MGPFGWQEMTFIFLLALVLFGPKKLPELGRMLGKAITEFRRAQSELKSTFEREMQNLERENQSLKEITGGYQYDNYNYNYDYSSSDSGTYGSTATETQDTTSTSTVSASATEGAESLSTVPPEGAIPHDSNTVSESVPEEGHVPAASGSVATDHKA